MKKISILFAAFLCMLLVSCKESAIEGYEWLEGTWEYDEENYGSREWAKVIITPSTYRLASSQYGDDDITSKPEMQIAIGEAYNYVNERDILALDTNYVLLEIDESTKQLLLTTGEYSEPMTLRQTSGYLIDAEKKNNAKTENESKLNSSNKSNTKKMDSCEKAWQQSLTDNEYIWFRTAYTDCTLPYYMVFHPFVFSEDKQRGMCYFVGYGEDPSRPGQIFARLGYYAEYEVVGAYLRLTDIIQDNKPNNYAKPRIYEMKTIDDELYLTGKFIHQNELTQIHQEWNVVPEVIINLLERDNICLHE